MKKQCKYGGHAIPCGDYLISRLALEMDEHPEIEKVDLLEFEMSYVPSKSFMPDAKCDSKMKTNIVLPGKQSVVETTSESILKGYVEIGMSISIIPPVPFTYPVDPAYKQLREALQQLAHEFSKNLHTKGM